MTMEINIFFQKINKQRNKWCWWWNGLHWQQFWLNLWKKFHISILYLYCYWYLWIFCKESSLIRQSFVRCHSEAGGTRVDFSWLTNPGNTIQTNPGNTIRNKYLNSDTHKYSNDTPYGHISSKLNSTMCFVCLILTSQNIYRGAVIFVESQNISQLMDENIHRKRSFDGFSPEADWALTHLQTFLSKQCKREPRWCKFFIWLKLLGSLGSFGQFFVVINFSWVILQYWLWHSVILP